MAKKKTVAKPEPSAERMTVFALKGSPAYRDWLVAISKKTLVPTSVMARDAFAKWASERNLPAPPEV
jgi:hypothetical protein